MISEVTGIENGINTTCFQAYNHQFLSHLTFTFTLNRFHHASPGKAFIGSHCICIVTYWNIIV